MNNNGYKNSPTGVLKDYAGDVDVKRHWHDLSFRRDTSLPIGKVVPLMNKIVQGNTKIKLNTHYALQTNPTVSPVFTPLDMYVKTAFCPIRLYVPGLYGNNYLELEEISDIALPGFYFAQGQYGVPNPGCAVLLGSLLNRLQYPLLAQGSNNENPTAVLTSGRTFDFGSGFISMGPAYRALNSLSVYAYYDVCRTLFADAYDKNIPFESTVVFKDDSASETVYRVRREEYIFDYDAILDKIYFSKGLRPTLPSGAAGNTSDVFLVTKTSRDASSALGVYGFPNLLSELAFEESDTSAPASWPIDNICVHDGLWPALFQSDLFNSYYDSEETDKLVVTTQSNIRSIRAAQAEFNLKASTLVRGKTYKGFNEVMNGGDVPVHDSPIFMGDDYIRIQFQDIVSTAATEGKPLGTPTSRGYGAEFDTPQIEFTTQEPGLVMCLACVVPRAGHNNAVQPDHHYKLIGDLPNRFYDGVGFQDLRAGDMNFTGVVELDELSVGTQPFFMEAMTGYDIVDGLLATSGYKSYTFTRQYTLGLDLDLDDQQEIIADPARLLEAEYGKYMRGSDFEYIFPFYAPINSAGVSNAQQIDNLLCQVYFDLRLYQPLTNQVVSTNPI